MPRRRVTTLMPVGPKSRSSGAASRKRAKTQSRTRPMTRWMAKICSASAPSWPVRRIIVAKAPGPAMSGVASGKTDGSSAWGSSAWSWRRSLRRSNSISRAVRNSRIPPAMRKAGIEMPKKLSTDSPAIPNMVSRPKAIRQARIAMPRLTLAVSPWVRAAKRGARPIGSMITKRATKAGI